MSKKYKQFLNCVASSLSNITVYSQSNHIAELRALREDTLREMQKLHNYHTYTNNPYFDN
jgi:hypothetical protein